jgi:hypothetical protein
MTVRRSDGYEEAPGVVRAASGLMMAGGVSHLATGAVTLSDNASRLALNISEQTVVGVGVAELGVIAALWWWMAAKCYAGRSWARALATLFFFAGLVLTVLAPTGAIATSGARTGLGWITVGIGVVSVVLLWTPEAGRYFRHRSGMDT